MPTNILRARNTKVSAKDARAPRGKAGLRRVLVTIGKVSFEAELLTTVTADRIWSALPLYSVAEIWGAAVHFELPLESGREPKATARAVAGTLYFWGEEHRVIIAYGATPISGEGEMHLPVPCSAWAHTGADLTGLRRTIGGAKVSLTTMP